MQRLTVYLILLFCLIALPAKATDYRYCVSCDTHSAQATVKTELVDFGKEWYRVKTGMVFQKAYGAQGCSVSEFSEAQCGSLPNEELVYLSVNGDQISGLLSGNPVLIGQTIVEVIVGVPVSVFSWTVEKGGELVDWIGSWF